MLLAWRRGKKAQPHTLARWLLCCCVQRSRGLQRKYADTHTPAHAHAHTHTHTHRYITQAVTCAWTLWDTALAKRLDSNPVTTWEETRQAHQPTTIGVLAEIVIIPSFPLLSFTLLSLTLTSLSLTLPFLSLSRLSLSLFRLSLSRLSLSLSRLSLTLPSLSLSHFWLPPLW